MESMLSAFTELAEDTGTLLDPAELGYADAAVHVSLERTKFGRFEINVALHQISGSQLAFVLGVARKYELEVREENGWLTLLRHLTSDDIETDPAEEAVHG